MITCWWGLHPDGYLVCLGNAADLDTVMEYNRPFLFYWTDAQLRQFADHIHARVGEVPND